MPSQERYALWRHLLAATLGWQLGFWALVLVVWRQTGTCEGDACGGFEGMLLFFGVAAGAFITAPLVMALSVAMALATGRILGAVLGAIVAAAASPILVPAGKFGVELTQAAEPAVGTGLARTVGLLAFGAAACAVPALGAVIAHLLGTNARDTHRAR
jgi:hypothetical protein